MPQPPPQPSTWHLTWPFPVGEGRCQPSRQRRLRRVCHLDAPSSHCHPEPAPQGEGSLFAVDVAVAFAVAVGPQAVGALAPDIKPRKNGGL
jgi:hypothetical protein